MADLPGTVRAGGERSWSLRRVGVFTGGSEPWEPSTRGGSDRTSTATLRANQLRLLLHSFAYVMMQTLRRVGLAGTRLAKAQCGTIRNKLLKVGVRVCVGARRIKLSFSESWPRAALFRQVLGNLHALSPPH